MCRDNREVVDAMERDELALDAINTIKDTVNPEKCEYSDFTFEYDDSKDGFRILECTSRIHDSVVVEGSVGIMIVAEVKNRELLKVGTIHLKEVERNEIVDLSVDGDRWEGDVLNNEPCGWGVMYDKSNNRMYEGFRVGEVHVCYRWVM